MKVKVGILETWAAGKEVIICVLSIDTALKNARRYCLYVKEPITTIVCLKNTLSLPLICIADYVNYQNVRMCPKAFLCSEEPVAMQEQST